MKWKCYPRGIRLICVLTEEEIKGHLDGLINLSGWKVIYDEEVWDVPKRQDTLKTIEPHHINI